MQRVLEIEGALERVLELREEDRMGNVHAEGDGEVVGADLVVGFSSP